MKIFPVIVIYNKNILSTVTYISLLKEVTQPFMIYDNSAGDYQDRQSFSENMVYIHDESNGGVSKAYNLAAKYAKENGLEWLLLLDQDTLFPPGSYQKYLEAIQEVNEFMLFAPQIILSNGKNFSPVKFFLKHAYAFPAETGRSYPIKSVNPVNSGMLVNVEAFFKVGGYNEKVPLDFSDYQFMEKFGKHHNEFFLLRIQCIQDFSNEEKDLEKLAFRFSKYCSGAKNCSRESYLDSICYFYVVLRRTIGLTVRTKSFAFFKVFYNKYICNPKD